jgi:hypothetical protein
MRLCSSAARIVICCTGRLAGEIAQRLDLYRTRRAFYDYADHRAGRAALMEWHSGIIGPVVQSDLSRVPGLNLSLCLSDIVPVLPTWVP